jgi:uncharacterized protein YecE (DUF72 family)
MHIHVGTSGYNYPEWRGTFYPEAWPAKKMFGYYAERFRTVEINYTFYRVPTPKTTGGWLAQAPDGFSYALKAPRRITHDKRLKDCADTVQFFVESARVLGPHLAPLLFQLPPNLKCDVGRLSAFLEGLPPDLRTAFEFRHESWLTDEVYGVLERHGVALCIADFGDHATPVRATARHGYFRLRDEGYQHADLERWADELAAHATQWDDAFVYFKHEDEGKGPEFARAFSGILSARGMLPAQATSEMPRL